MSAISRYFKGMQIFFSGWHLFWQHKAIRRLAYAPIAISLVVLVVGGIYGFDVIPWIIGIVTPYLSGSLGGFVLFLVSVVLHIIYAVLLIVFLFLSSNLLAIPFNAIIAEKTMSLVGGDYFEPKTKAEWLKFNASMLMTGLVKTLLVLILGVFVFVLSFIPFVGPVASFFSIFVLAFDSCDYGLELKNKKLKQRMDFIKKYFWELSGYTTVMAVTFLIPGLNFFLLPVFITAGTNFVSNNVQLSLKAGKEPAQ